MKQIKTYSPYILYTIPAQEVLKGAEKKNDISNPHFLELGINFANISAGKLYPETGLCIKYLGLGQKEMASHLDCVNQLY